MLKGVLRPDGVTRRFKSDRGLYDDDVGIKRRLLQALAKFDPGRSITTIDEKIFDSGYETGGATRWQM